MKRQRADLDDDPVHEIGRLTTRITELQGAVASAQAELEGLIASGRINSERGRELLRLGHANQQSIRQVTARQRAAMVNARSEASPFPAAGPPASQAGSGFDIGTIKELSKRVRKGVPADKRGRSAMYADVLALINSFYPDDGAAWRRTAELLPTGRLESGATYLPASTIGKALRVMLADDRTRLNGLMLVQRIAKLSGSLNQDYRPVLRRLSEAFGFPLDIADASKGTWDLIDVTDEGGIAVRKSTTRKRDQEGDAELLLNFARNAGDASEDAQTGGAIFLPNRPMGDFHPAYDEAGEADGSSDEEDFDAWADEHIDSDEELDDDDREALKKIARAERRKYTPSEEALSQLRAQVTEVDRDVGRLASQPQSSSMFDSAALRFGAPDVPGGLRYDRRPWRPGDTQDYDHPEMDYPAYDTQVWGVMQDLLRRKQSILKDIGVVETRDYPGYAETGIHPKIDVPRQRELWAELTARAAAKQEELDAPRRVPQGVFLARQRMLPQYSGPVTKKARAGADQAGDGAPADGMSLSGPPMRIAQVFTPGTEGVMFTRRAIQHRERQQAHRGASAEQQILAGTGVLPPPPGYHYMSTGVLMQDG